MTKVDRPKETEKFRVRAGARVVIVLFEDGETTGSWTDAAMSDPEQMRMDLITAANNAARYIKESSER